MTVLDTMTTPDGTAVTHPGWCHPARCTVLPDLPLDDGVHNSQAVTIDAAITTAGMRSVHVWLHQEAATDVTYLVVDIADSHTRAMFELSAAAGALDTVTGLLDRAGDHTELQAHRP